MTIESLTIEKTFIWICAIVATILSIRILVVGYQEYKEGVFKKLGIMDMTYGFVLLCVLWLSVYYSNN
jgi:hypothetical protein